MIRVYDCMRSVLGWWNCFLFKQKTAYEMLISDWSSDVCSSDLVDHVRLDVVEQALVVGDHQEGAVGRAQRVDAFGHRLQRIDVQARIGLVEDEIGRASCRERVRQSV